MSDRLLIDSMVTVVTRFFSKGANFVVFVILAHVLSLQQFGRYGYIMAVTLLWSTVCDFGTRHSVTYYLGAEPGKTKAIVSQALLWNLIFTVLGGVALALYLEMSAEIMQTKEEIISAVAMFVVLNTIRIQQAVPLGIDGLKTFNKSESIPRVMLVVFTIALWATGTLTLSTALWSFFASNLAAAGYLLAVSVKVSGMLRIEKDITLKLIRRGSMFLPGVVLMILSKRASILMLEELSTAQDVGAFFGAQRLAEIVTEVALAVGIVVFSHNVKQQDKATAIKSAALITRSTTFLLGIICLILAISASQIVGQALGSSFDDKATLLRLCLLNTFMATIWTMLYPSLSAIENPFLSFWLFLPGTALNLVALYFLTSRFGAEGAAVASVAANFVISMSFLLTYKYRYGTKISDFILPRYSEVFGAVAPFARKIYKKIR